MLNIQLLSSSLFFLALPLIIIIIINKSKKSSSSNIFPNSYPIIGSYFTIKSNRRNRLQWITEILRNSPSSTYTLRHLFGHRQVLTANPANVQHMLKTHFHIYQKGPISTDILFDFLGQGIFNVDGESWKFQRQVSSHQFNTKSLRNFVQTVVDAELHDRLIPTLKTGTRVLIDLQDILQRFAFDNICKIAFGFDAAYLLPCLPKAELAEAFDVATNISSERFRALSIVWRLKRFLNVGSEKRLKHAVSRVRDFALKVVREKKQEQADDHHKSSSADDLLSRFLSSGHSDENFVTDIVISFILAGRDTTSAALTWFFWLIHKHPRVEEEILREIFREKSEMAVFEEVKDMVYTHASLCESMRLYPPVAVDSKYAVDDDVLPDGSVVRKGMVVTYHPYAMGRMEKIWGSDWAEFKPERWLEMDEATGKWSFVARDPYTYPVFQAGPRICLGKEMAFLQMKRVVAGVLRRFKVVPAVEDGFEPEFVAYLTAKMKGGLPVRIEDRAEFNYDN